MLKVSEKDQFFSAAVDTKSPYRNSLHLNMIGQATCLVLWLFMSNRRPMERNKLPFLTEYSSFLALLVRLISLDVHGLRISGQHAIRHFGHNKVHLLISLLFLFLSRVVSF